MKKQDNSGLVFVCQWKQLILGKLCSVQNVKFFEQVKGRGFTSVPRLCFLIFV